MIEQLMQALNRPGVNDWLLRQVRTQSTQLFLARTEPENRREALVEEYGVEVHNDHAAAQDGRPSRGSATVTLLPGEEGWAAERIEQAVFMAGLTDNPPYSLPGPGIYPEVLISDRRLVVDPGRAARELADELRAAVAAEPAVSLASAEFFIDRRQVALRNSRGIQAEQEGTSLLLDFVLLARDDEGHETEAHVEVRRRDLAGLDLPALVRRQAQYARDTLQAAVPASGRLAVLVSDDALHQLLAGEEISPSPFAFRSSAQAKYQHLTPWEVGRSVFGDLPATGDPLTIYANAILPWGTASARFDSEGLPGRRLPIIENGVLQRFWAGQRYADYLQIPPTGEFGNLEVMPGSLPIADLWQDVFYQVVAFSSMMPDPVSGNFVAEIRLGYEKRGNQIRPIKGGSLSGNLFTDLAAARLSQETVMMGNYLGPQAVRFPALTISGG